MSMADTPRLFQIPSNEDLQVAEIYFSNHRPGSTLLVDHTNSRCYMRVKGIEVPVGDRIIRADIQPSQNTWGNPGLEAIALATIQGNGIRRFEEEIKAFAKYLPEDLRGHELEFGYFGGKGTEMMGTYVRPNAQFQEIVSEQQAIERNTPPWEQVKN